MLHSEIRSAPAHPLLPLLLLASCGLVFAAKIMVSKVALDAGANPFQLGVVGNLGAAVLLSIWLVVRREGVSVDRRSVALYLALGVISVAVPTVLSFFVVDRVGPAYTATVYSLSPLLTMSFAAGFGIERVTVSRSVGIGIGLLGVVALVHQQVVSIDFTRPVWVAIGLFIPACAALGNIIRSAFWPEGASALAFACATLFTSSVVVAVLSMVLTTPSQWRFNDLGVTLACGGFVLTSAVSYVLNFRLQSVAGPVVFSQIGYWGTGFGVLLAAALFGDVLTTLSLSGLAAIIGGGSLANRHRAG